MLITIQTLRLDSAARITAVIPYLCYARSDKKDQPRVPITARLVADMIEVAGADRYMTMDLHAGQIQGFFSIPGDVLTGFYILTDYLKTIKDTLHNPWSSPRFGFAKRRAITRRPASAQAFIEKRRLANNAKAEALSIIGDVKDRDVLLVDDEINTGGSISQAVHLIKENGARDVYISFVHAIFSPDAVQRLAALPVKQFITTDTVPVPPEPRRIRYRQKSLVCPLLSGETRANEGRSVGELFNE